MPRPAASIIARAGQIAKVGNISQVGQFVGYKIQALDELNSILDHLAQTMDFSAAMATYDFTFNTNLTNIGNGNIVQAAPNPLPLDYLRVQTSGGVTGAQRSSKWYLDGVPYDMVELDLTEWDDQVQQPGIQSYPYFWAKDMSQRRIVSNFTGDIIDDTPVITNLSATAFVEPGMSIAGGYGNFPLVVPGTTVVAVSPGQLTMSNLPISRGGPVIGFVATSLMTGYPPVGYPYPPPSGAFNVRIRYQRLPPPITQFQVDSGHYCWFDDDDYLIEALAGRLMRFSDDSRVTEFIGDGIGNVGRAGRRLAEYAKLADDRSNRATTVQLDRRSFGAAFSKLRHTKKVGWQLWVALWLGALSAGFC